MCKECLLSHLQKNIHSLLFEHLTDTELVHGTSTVQNANYLSKNYHFSLVTLKGNEIDLPPCLNVPPSGFEIKFFFQGAQLHLQKLPEDAVYRNQYIFGLPAPPNFEPCPYTQRTPYTEVLDLPPFPEGYIIYFLLRMCYFV